MLVVQLVKTSPTILIKTAGSLKYSLFSLKKTQETLLKQNHLKRFIFTKIMYYAGKIARESG
jgi:hypothetical protein